MASTGAAVTGARVVAATVGESDSVGFSDGLRDGVPVGDPVGPAVGDVDASNVNPQSMILNSFFSVVMACGRHTSRFSSMSSLLNYFNGERSTPTSLVDGNDRLVHSR